MKSIDFMTAKKTDFKELPNITELPKKEREFDSLIIIPERYKHDSGYMCMSFAGCKGDKAVCLMGGGSDIIHFDGIGGEGRWWNGAGRRCESDGVLLHKKRNSEYQLGLSDKRDLAWFRFDERSHALDAIA